MTTQSQQLRDLNAELDDIYTMSEEAACFLYNVDTKEEIILILQEQIQAIEAEVEEVGDDEAQLYHFAFPTERSFWNYKY